MIGKGLKGGMIMMAAVLVAAIIYSSVYFSQGLYRIDSGGRTIFLVLLWALVVVVLLLVLWQRSLIREEQFRKCYFSRDGMFNNEFGYLPLSEVSPSGSAEEVVAYLADALPSIAYGPQVANPPEGFIPDFAISNRRFHFHDGEDGPVIDSWRGVLQRMQQRDLEHRVFVEVGSFSSRDELASLLRETGAFK